MPPETTPMMQQYLRMKELHQDCILFCQHPPLLSLQA